jgi:hypothetical protein
VLAVAPGHAAICRCQQAWLCLVGGQSCRVEQARNPRPFADVKPEPPPMSRVTSDGRSARTLSITMCESILGEGDAGCTKQVVRLQLHHMRGSSPSASQQMPCFLQPEQRDCCCTDTLPCSRLHIVPGPINGPPSAATRFHHASPGARLAT